jgi:hypothetical protein
MLGCDDIIHIQVMKKDYPLDTWHSVLHSEAEIQIIAPSVS